MPSQSPEIPDFGGVQTLPTVLICPGSPLEISQMLAACGDTSEQCRLIWWGRSPRIGEKIRAELPTALVLPCLFRGATLSQGWKQAPFRVWCDQALRWEKVLAARRGQTLGATHFALAATEVAEAVRVLSLMRPDVVLIKAGTRLHEAAWSAVARGLGIARLYTERGAFPASLFLDSAGVGPDMSLHRAADPTPEQRAAAENYFARYQQDAQSAWQQPNRKGGPQLRRELGIDPRDRLLFYAAQVENDANNVLYSPHFPSNNAFLRFVMDALGDAPGTVVVAKPHPKETAPLTSGKRDGRSRLIINRDINIKDILPESDAVLTLNSNVGFEALLFGKPVACGASSYYSHRGWTFDVTSPQDTESLRQWLRNPQLSPAQRRDFERFSVQTMAQNLFFQQSAPGLQGPAEYLRKILDAPRPAYTIDPFLVHQAEEILVQAGATYESLSLARRLGQAWQQVAVKLKR